MNYNCNTFGLIDLDIASGNLSVNWSWDFEAFFGNTSKTLGFWRSPLTKPFNPILGELFWPTLETPFSY